MYTKIQATSVSGSKPKRDTILIVPVIAAACLLMAIAGSIVYFAGTYPRFWNYIEKLSASTYYSYENLSLKVYVDGELIRTGKDNAYYAYEYLSSDGIGKPRKTAPDRECDIKIVYGDGAVLSCWRIDPAEEPEYIEGERIFVAYLNGDYSYMYTAEHIDIDTLERHLRR